MGTMQAIDLIIAYGMDVVAALAIMVIGWIISGWAGKKARSALGRAGTVDATLVPFLSDVARYTILIFVLIAVLGKFGVQTASIIAVLGAAGLAVGLALQGTLSHLAAGVVLLILRPFKIGEVIDAGGKIGSVEEIGIFATILKTADGIFIYIPNGSLLGAAITNFSRNAIRRIDITVGISYSDDITKSLSIAQKLLEEDGRVLKDPSPQTMVMSLGDSSVNIHMRCWANGGDYWNVLFDLNKGIKEGYDAGGISIPFPRQDIHIVDHTKD